LISTKLHNSILKTRVLKLVLLGANLRKKGYHRVLSNTIEYYGVLRDSGGYWVVLGAVGD